MYYIRSHQKSHTESALVAETSKKITDYGTKTRLVAQLPKKATTEEKQMMLKAFTSFAVHGASFSIVENEGLREIIETAIEIGYFNNYR